MDLLLWRHAVAQVAAEGQDDLDRALTPAGRQQARRVGRWLYRALPARTLVYCSPARRAEETAVALGREMHTLAELAPSLPIDPVLEALGWNAAASPGSAPVLLVGHQPQLGQIVARLIGLQQTECAIRKGSVWWLRSRVRDGRTEVRVITVLGPELLF